MGNSEQTLCARCADALRSSGYDVTRTDAEQTVYGECDICKGKGMDYDVAGTGG